MFVVGENTTLYPVHHDLLSESKVLLERCTKVMKEKQAFRIELPDEHIFTFDNVVHYLHHNKIYDVNHKEFDNEDKALRIALLYDFSCRHDMERLHDLAMENLRYRSMQDMAMFLTAA